jgi:hypothetical protein
LDFKFPAAGLDHRMSLVPPKGFDLTMENYRDISAEVVAESLA